MATAEKIGYQFGEFCLRFKGWQHPTWLKIAYVVGGLALTIVVWQFIFALLFLGLFVWNSKQPDPSLDFDTLALVISKNDEEDVSPYDIQAMLGASGRGHGGTNYKVLEDMGIEQERSFHEMGTHW